MTELRKKWWLLALQGLFFLSFGTTVLFSLTLESIQLMEILGFSFLGFGGIFFLVSWITRKMGTSVWSISIGIIQVILAVLILSYPQKASYIYGISIGIWAAIVSIWQLFLAFRDKEKRWLYLINGVVSVICAILILINPFQTGKSSEVVGFYSILLGAFIIYFSFRFRKSRGTKSAPKQEVIASNDAKTEN